MAIDKNASGSGGTLTLDRGIAEAVAKGTNIRRHDYTRYKDTLADVAMAYWKNDLLPGKGYDPTKPETDKQDDEFANNVPMGASDFAFWQHMNTVVLHMGDGASVRSRDDTGSASPLIESIAKGEDWLLANDLYWGYKTGADSESNWCNDNHTGDGTGGKEWCNPGKSDAGGGADVLETPQRYLYGNDLLHAAINSYGAYVSAQSPEELTQALNQAVAAMNSAEDATFAAVATNDGARGRALIYQPRFSSTGWYGRLEAYRICTEADVRRDSTIDPVSKQRVLRTPQHNERAKCLNEGNLWAVPDWDASERLAQQICGSSKPEDCKTFSSGNRHIILGDGATGKLLTANNAWDSLSDEQKAAFGDVDRFYWFLGDPTRESTLRSRKAEVLNDDDLEVKRFPLGDIVNSAPLFVGADDFGYANAGGLNTTMRTAYRQRKVASSFRARPEVLYVAANDGMLHAFAAQSNVEQFSQSQYNYDDGKPTSGTGTGLPTGARDAATGNFTEDGGKEYFAFVPGSLKLGELASSAYVHSYNMDGSPVVRDAWIDSKWQTVLAGSTGAGGNAYYALNVEDPKNPKVIWERTKNSTGFENLGVTIGQPSIAIIAQQDSSGNATPPKSVAIFGNGYNSALRSTTKASLFIADLEGDGVTEIKTPETTGCTDNGLSTPLVADLNKDGVAETAYAGDLCGNLWKFNLSATSDTPVRLLSAVDANSKRQPITAQPEVARVRAKTGGSRIMVYVGTGKFVDTGDKSERQPQTLYGIVDTGATVKRSDLLEQVIDKEVVNNYPGLQGEMVRIITDKTPGATVAAADYKGFYIDLVVKNENKKGERVIAKPTVWSDRVIFTTIQPGTDECSAEGTGFLYEVDPYYGGRLAFTVFDVDGNGEFGNPTDLVEGKHVSGREIGMGGGVTTRGSNKYVGNTKGQVTKTANNPKGMPLGRRSWRQIR
jgi:type IV pilus assembly protein PilY1